MRRAAREVPKVNLDDCGLNVNRQSLWQVFEPFTLPATTDDDRTWHHDVMRRRKRIRKDLARRTLGWKTKVTARTTEFVKNSYHRKWIDIGYSNYDVTKRQGNYTPWLWHQRRFLASTYGSPRFRHLLLAAAIEELKPESVLEIGCGNGINLLLLANRFPEIRFSGIDLTESGPQLFNSLKVADALPANLTGYAPLPARDPTAFRKVMVGQGSAAHLDFDDRSFDLVMSVLALEQMEDIRETALAEMARVCAHWALMIEPFREVNGYLHPRLNVLRQKYFQGRIGDLPKYGLEPIFATDDLPQEIHLRACMVCAVKWPRTKQPDRPAARS